MFSQIDTSLDPDIIGTKTEYNQVVVDKKSLKKSNYYRDYYPYIFTYLHDINKINEIDLGGLKGRLHKKAKFTDIMKFTPSIRGSSFIVSEKFVKALLEFGVSVREYSLKPIAIDGETKKHYLLFVPRLNLKHIDYERSILYRSVLFETKPLEYLAIKNHDEYQAALDKHTYVSFEKMVLDDIYSNNEIINVPQATSHMFFRDDLIEHLFKSKISNLVLRSPKQQVHLEIHANAS